MNQISVIVYDHIFDFDADRHFPQLFTQVKNSIVVEHAFVEPTHISKSSVGEFYQKNMKEFMSLSKDVFDYVYATAPETISGPVSMEEVCFIAAQVMPLGALFDTNDFVVDCTSQQLSAAYSSQLMEIRELLPHLFKASWLEEHFKKTLIIEKISQSLCVGYNPNLDVPAVDVVKHDNGFKREYLIADILYPWVTQPLKQLRMMIPSLPKEVTDNIIKNAINKDLLLNMPAGNLCHDYTYDCVTDFISYLSLRTFRTEYNRNFTRQIWTPFFGITHYEALKKHIKDATLFDRVEKAFLTSKKLYVEMLKTGLRYEAQYAVLGGMAGRFVINGSLSGMLGLCDPHINQLSVPALEIIRQIVKETEDGIC